MLADLTEVSFTGSREDKFPEDAFCINFNLKIQRQKRRWEYSIMLSLVWAAPMLPGPKHIVHVGRGDCGIVIQMPDHVPTPVWEEDGAVTLDAYLLHITDPQDFMVRMQRLLDTCPEYQSRLHAVLLPT